MGEEIAMRGGQSIQDDAGKAPPYRLAFLVLGVTMFVTGLTGLVFEYILSTVATYVLGNSVEQFAITIGIMLACMGVGGFAQKFIRAERPVAPFILVEMALALLGGFAPILMYGSFSLFESHFKLVQYAIAGSIGLLIGSEIPFASRINEDFTGVRLPENLAGIFLLDYLGGFIGAITFARFLLPSLPLTEMSFLLAGAILGVALLNFLYFVRGRRLRALIGFLAVGAVLAYGYGNNREWNVALEQRLYRDKIVFARTSPYQRIVLQHNREKGEYRLTLNGSLQFSSLDEARYHEFLVYVPMLFAPPDRRVRVLILGGGDGLGLREVLKYPNVESVTLVDLDPEMVRFAATHTVMVGLNRGAFANARVRVLHFGAVVPGPKQALVVEGQRPLRARRMAPAAMKVAEVSVLNLDADRFLGEIQEVYDLVIIDFPDPRSIELCKLYTKEFYLKLRRVLAEHGMVAVQSTSVYYSREPFLMIGRTLRAAGLSMLPYHHEVPSFGDWGWHLAWKDVRSVEMVRGRLKAIRALPVPTEYLTAALVANSVDFGRKVLDSTSQEINTLMQPRLLDLYLRSWVTD